MIVALLRSDRSIYFVDACGGALSVLAAGVAGSLGVDAVAATSTEPSPIPKEVATALAEVGTAMPKGAAAPFKTLGRGAAEVVFLGGSAPTELAGGPAWDVPTVEGPGDLERLSAARIARDRIERRLGELVRSG